MPHWGAREWTQLKSLSHVYDERLVRSAWWYICNHWDGVLRMLRLRKTGLPTIGFLLSFRDDIFPRLIESRKRAEAAAAEANEAAIYAQKAAARIEASERRKRVKEERARRARDGELALAGAIPNVLPFRPPEGSPERFLLDRQYVIELCECGQETMTKRGAERFCVSCFVREAKQ
jgi:hypothetical protein